VPDLTVVTNSIPVANVLHREPRPDLTVVLTGGVRTPSDALVGPVAVATMRSLHLDLLFVGVHGMAEGVGFTTPNLLEAEANQDFIASAARIAVIADHTKWNVRGLCRFARLGEVHVLVTDSGLPHDARTVLAEQVQKLVITPVPHGKRADGMPSNDGRS
jgi:DeoR/GlpR family transcriptional regulator of sugar metabolism